MATKTKAQPQLARTIRERRSKRGESLRELSANTNGLAISYLNRIEKGQVGEPGPNTLRRLGAALDLPYAQLMRQAGYLP